jgi:hypothetical protein
MSSSQIQRIIEECQIREHLRSQRELELLSRPHSTKSSLSDAADHKSTDAITASGIGILQPFCKGNKHSKLREPRNSLASSWELHSSPASIYRERLPYQASRGSPCKPRHSLPHRKDSRSIRFNSANTKRSDTKRETAAVQSHGAAKLPADTSSLWQGVQYVALLRKPDLLVQCLNSYIVLQPLVETIMLS